MQELAQAYWPYFIIALLIGIAVAWWCFVALRRTRVVTENNDVLDEGAAPAARNQALIDAPPASFLAAEPEDVAAPAPPAGSYADDMTRIKGVGPKLVTLLKDLGITSFAQIAAWDDAEIDRIDSKLGRFEGRIRRDDWVTQAQLLASGDTGAYEDRFGKV